MALTHMDIHELMKDPSPERRAQVANKVAVLYHDFSTNDREKAIAVEILNILARDIEVAVRRSVALSIMDSMSVPHDLVWRLANDVADVAGPILQNSTVLTEDDLIAIVKSTKEVVKLVHIAKRDTISTSLADALLDCADEKTTHTLLLNKGANIADDSLMRQWDGLVANPTLVDVLVRRGGLSVNIAEKLFTIVSDEMKRHLSKQYKLPITIVEDNIEDIREWTSLGMLMPDDEQNGLSETDLESFVHQLYTSNRLTYSMVIRALCTGDLAFFEAAMARLAGVQRNNARILMFDSGPLGFKAFYEKANMPPAFYEAIRSLLKISLEITKHGRVKREDFRQRVIEGIYRDRLHESVDNMQYLLTVIGGQFVPQHEVVH